MTPLHVPSSFEREMGYDFSQRSNSSCYSSDESMSSFMFISPDTGPLREPKGHRQQINRPLVADSPMLASTPAVNLRKSASMPSEKITPASGIRERMRNGRALST